MKASNPRFNETDVTFWVSKFLGWDNVDVFPKSVIIEHDYDHRNPYEVDGHVFYDRESVRYVPERTCHPVEVLEDDNDFAYLGCSECGEPLKYRELADGYVPMPYCPNCGAKVMDE